MKRLLWLWTRILVLFGLFVLIGLLPALSVIRVSAVPPLADMPRSEGTISFRPVGGKSGSLTIVKNSDGHKEEFSCRETLHGLHDCIDRRHAGGFTQIHWFWVKPLVGQSYRFPVQIVVNGEVVRDRAKTIEQIENTRVTFQYGLAPLAFLFFLIGVFFMVAPKGIVTDPAVDHR